MDYTPAYRKDGKPYEPKRIQRKFNRWMRKQGQDSAVQAAYELGMFCYMTGNRRANPYPAGKRHDEFNRGCRS